MTVEVALARIDELNQMASSKIASERVSSVVMSAMQLMKCMVLKDQEGLCATAFALRMKHTNAIEDVKEQLAQKKNYPLHLLYGVLDVLQLSARTMIESEGANQDSATCLPRKIEPVEFPTFSTPPAVDDVQLEPGIVKEENDEGNSFTKEDEQLETAPIAIYDREIKEEVEEEDNTMDEYEFPTFSTPPAVYDVKLEVIVKEEPLCPPLFDSITVPSTSSSTFIALDQGNSTNCGPVRAEFVKRKTSLYHCNKCRRSFRTQSNFKNHSHSRRTYKCDDCDYVCITKRDLNKHRKLHSLEAKYQCCHCDLHFASHRATINHTREVHGSRPYTCDTCNASFVAEMTLHWHRFKVHNIQPDRVLI